MRESNTRNDAGPGVPEAIPRGLQHLTNRYGGEALDRIWIFPPLISGRKEWGLLVASVFTEPDDRRVLVSASYTAERTGRGLTLERSLQEQGEAPPDRFPRVVDGVVRRAEKDLGEPREIVVEGRVGALAEVMDEFDPELLDPELWPAAEPEETLTETPAEAPTP